MSVRRATLSGCWGEAAAEGVRMENRAESEGECALRSTLMGTDAASGALARSGVAGAAAWVAAVEAAAVEAAAVEAAAVEAVAVGVAAAAAEAAAISLQ